MKELFDRKVIPFSQEVFHTSDDPSETVSVNKTSKRLSNIHNEITSNVKEIIWESVKMTRKANNYLLDHSILELVKLYQQKYIQGYESFLDSCPPDMETNIEYFGLVHDLVYKQATMTCQVNVIMLNILDTLIEKIQGDQGHLEIL